MGVRDWDIVTSYVDSVTTSLKTVNFPKVQEQVKVKNQGNANLTYTIGSQSGTLTPGQSVTVKESLSSFTIQAVSGVQSFEVKATELGTEIVDTDIQLPSDVAGTLNQLTTQMSEKAQQSDLLLEKIKNMGVTYGEIKLPSDFLTLPCTFYRDIDGKVKHNYDFTKHKTGTPLYVNRDTGNDTTGNGTTATPYKTLYKALSVATSGADNAYKIICQSYRFDRDETLSGSAKIPISGKTIAIVPEDPTKTITITGGQRSLTWTADGGGTWKTTRSLVFSVFDLRKRDVYGVAIPLEYKTTLADCQATPNTWYTDGASVWVHSYDGLTPTETNFAVNINFRIFSFILLNNATLYVENCEVYGGANDSGNMQIEGDSTGVVQGVFVANNCISVGGYQTTTVNNNTNNLATINLKQSLLFNCKAPYSCRDGFNYHYTNIALSDQRKCLVLEYNGLSYKNGVKDFVNGNNNCYTAHEGVNIIRVNCVGFESTGPILADVNGCYSICIDCSMGNSLATWTATDRYVAYEFYTDPNSASKIYLMNCAAHGDHNHLYVPTGVDCHVQRLKLYNVHDPVNFILMM